MGFYSMDAKSRGRSRFLWTKGCRSLDLQMAAQQPVWRYAHIAAVQVLIHHPLISSPVGSQIAAWMKQRHDAEGT
jgi:hypothetical protein